MTVDKIEIAKEFSDSPLGRFYTDGDSSGEQFREEILKPKLEALKPGETISVVLDDGVQGYGSSFLVEGFAGIVKYGYMDSRQLLEKLIFEYSDDDFDFYKEKIIQYVKAAKFNSQSYESTKE